MSEYQYYEFLAIDRPLTAKQIDELREFSTRAEITSTSFTNEYHWGNFRGDPKHFLTRYFDAMVYTANWGTRQFMFRLPKNLVNLKAVEPYCSNESLNITPSGDYYIFNIMLQEDESDRWDEDGGSWMASLAGLRAEVLKGDYRPLYLSWLLDLQAGAAEDDDPQPPIPPGLIRLTAPQKALTDFLGIDRELLFIAASSSPAIAPVDPINLVEMLARIPAAEKDRWLVELLENDDPHASMRLRLKLEATSPIAKTKPVEAKPSLAAAQLRKAWQERTKQAEELERHAATARHKKQEAEAAAKREKHLTELASKMEIAWNNADQLIGLRTKGGYQQAVELLKDLKVVSERPGQNPAAFHRELKLRIEEHGKKATFMTLLRRANLL